MSSECTSFTVWSSVSHYLHCQVISTSLFVSNALYYQRSYALSLFFAKETTIYCSVNKKKVGDILI